MYVNIMKDDAIEINIYERTMIKAIKDMMKADTLVERVYFRGLKKNELKVDIFFKEGYLKDRSIIDIEERYKKEIYGILGINLAKISISIREERE